MEKPKGIFKSDLGRRALAGIALPAASLGFIPAHHAANSEVLRDNFENRVSISAMSNLSSSLTTEDKLAFTLTSAGTIVFAAGIANKTLENAYRKTRLVTWSGLGTTSLGLLYANVRVWS